MCMCSSEEFTTTNECEVLFCILFPPLAVYLHSGGNCNYQVLINVILLCFLWLPAVIHAIWYCCCSGTKMTTSTTPVTYPQNY